MKIISSTKEAYLAAIQDMQKAKIKSWYLTKQKNVLSTPNVCAILDPGILLKLLDASV